GIAIGEGDPVGEAFKAFLEHVLRLKQRGVLLAVCSKNEDAIARAPFRERSEMVLRLEDFACFRIDWRPKPVALREIAAELNIGLDSLVFVDDNPVEREHVRQWTPEVRVVELTDDPADYPRLLDEAGHFEVTTLSTEDAQRTRQYQENARRRELEASVADYRAYVSSLEQRAVVGSFEEAHLDRITQLINKSNQFNLTTLRMSRSEVEAAMRDGMALTATVRLADRFGDNGLISVFLARRDGDELRIDEWLMSCRVLNRGVEQLLLNHVVEEARRMGARTLHGVYIPTPRNALVRDHYKSLSFAPAGGEEDGTTHWTLDVSAYRPFDPAITVVEDY
ncbi:MAG: HAD-IIIC family phosphatase, partial [Candidatus Binatia bacterium]